MTRVGSRRVIQISAGFMIFFSILGKFSFHEIGLILFAPQTFYNISYWIGTVLLVLYDVLKMLVLHII